jgi:hypothetical protein
MQKTCKGCGGCKDGLLASTTTDYPSISSMGYLSFGKSTVRLPTIWMIYEIDQITADVSCTVAVQELLEAQVLLFASVEDVLPGPGKIHR